MRRISLALLTVSAFAISSSAMAADLIIDTPAMPGVVEVASDWEGPFVGVFGGYASGELTSENALVDGTGISGWMLGVTAGVNFAITDGVIAGVVGDIAWNNIGMDEEDGDYTSGWNGSLRGRLGFDGGAFMPYLTAGLAVGRGEFDGIENTHLGWTVGAGLEVAVAQDLSLDLQYRYTDYADETYLVDAGATTHAVTIGLNWGF
jgi:outer membrane immunogenic protein